MEFLNLHLPKTLRSAEFIGSDPVCRATWLCLMGYCAETENGGRIVGCREWKDRKWQQICGITLREVSADSDLWTWQGDDLFVVHYPLEAETNLKTKREIARTNGQTGGRRKQTDVGSNVGTDIGSDVGSDMATENEPTLASLRKGKGKGMKGNEMEGEEDAASPPIAADRNPEIIESIRLAYPRHTHMRDATIQIAAAIKRAGGDWEKILAGCRRIAASVAGWSENERLSFIKNPPEFFAGDHWADDADFWKSKNRQPSQQPRPKIDIGGRKPAGVMTSHLD